MEKFIISFYQSMSYFACGFVVLFCCYFDGATAKLPKTINDFSSAFYTDKSTFAVGFIIAFIIGYAIHIIRQGLVEWIATEFIWIKWGIKKNKKDIDLTEEQKKKVEKVEINWDFFHNASSEEIEKMTISYYTGYSFAWNMIFALTIVCICFVFKSSFIWNAEHLKVISVILTIILLFSLFIVRIRKQIVTATKKSTEKIDDKGVLVKDIVSDKNCSSIPKIETEMKNAKEALKNARKYIDEILSK